MDRAWQWMAAGLVVGALPACSMLKKPGADAGDGGESEAAAAVVEAAASLAANEADIARYPDEKSTTGSALTTEAPAELRTEVGAGGKLVVVLKKGSQVDKIAEHSSHYLIVGEDPKDSTRKLMGWASQAAFAVPVHHAHDAGASGDSGAHPATTADAGAAPTPAPATGPVCVKQNPPGTCPAGFAVSQAVCRVPCKVATDCRGPEPKCNGGLCYNASGCN